MFPKDSYTELTNGIIFDLETIIYKLHSKMY
jgi:hypothetical protein